MKRAILAGVGTLALASACSSSSSTTSGTQTFTGSTTNLANNATVPITGSGVVTSTSGTYTVTGGTGSYKGATGHGDYKITFDGKFALTNGKCAPTPSSNPVSGSETFHASGPLTVES